MKINLVETESQKVNLLEKKVNSMDNKLEEMMILLKKTPSPAKPLSPAVPNVWQDKEKLASIKVPPSSLLVVKKGDDLSKNQANRNDIEKIVVNNNIPVVQTKIRPHVIWCLYANQQNLVMN